MRRAIHRLERHPLGGIRHDRAFILDIRNLVRDHEHVLAILAPVAALLPLARIHHLRGLDLAVAGRIDRAAHIGLELAPHHIALGVPEHRAMRFLLKVEQVHFLAQLAVIAQQRLLDALHMLVELLPVQPAGAVDPAEHRVLLVAAPVCARDTGKLERIPDRACRWRRDAARGTCRARRPGDAAGRTSRPSIPRLRAVPAPIRP